MKRARQRRLCFLLYLVVLAALPFFFLPFPSEPSDPDKVDALAPVETVAEGFKEPTGIAIDPSGTVFVSDRKTGKVFKIIGGKVETLVTHLRRPAGLAFDTDGRLIIVEEKSGHLLRLEEDGRLTVLVEGIKKPRWATVTEDGAIYLTAKSLKLDKKEEDEDDEEGEVILRLTPHGSLLTVFVDDFKGLQGIVIDGGALFAAAKGLKKEKKDNGGIFKIPVRPDGTAGPISRLTQNEIKRPFGLVMDRLGALYVSAEEFTEAKKKAKDAIGKIAPDGVFSRFGSKLQDPRGLAFDGSGYLYVADDQGDRKGRVIRFRAPPPPTLVFPSFTKQSSLTLNGKAEANSRIDAFLNDSTSPITLTTPDGNFDLKLDLKLNAQNSLDVFTTAHNGLGLASAPAELTIVHDATPPSIINLEPISGSFLNTRTPLIRASFSDAGSGVNGGKVEISLDKAPTTSQITASGFTLTPNPLSEGPHTVSVTIFDRAGNSAAAFNAFTVDVTPPLITNLSPADGSVAATDRPLIRADLNDNFGISLGSVRIFLDGVDGTAQASVSASGFTLDPSNPLTLQPFNLSQGSHTVSVSVADLAGNSATASSTFAVTTSPEITAFSPGSGTVGSEVTIQGRSFDPSPGKSVVRFNGVRAVITNVTETTIRTIVPIGATIGRITVKTPRGIGTSTDDFIVLLRQDFALSLSPGVGIAVQGSPASYLVQILSTGSEPFTGLTQLTIGPLPAGVTASLNSPALGSNSPGILTLTTTSSTPVGSNVVEVRATSQIEGHSVTRTATITLGVQAPGQTVLTGQVRDENDRPLAGVSIKQGGSTLTNLGMTDAGGNFFIPLFVTGAQVFLIDGSTANTPSVNYSTIPVTLDIQAGVVNTLGFTPHLHAQPVAKLTPITPGQGTVLTHPDVPGFTMTIPSGAQIIGWDGQPNTQFSVTTVLADRSPLPPFPSSQASSQIYLFNFGKMGGGIPKGNISIDTPNDVSGLPGEKVDLYYFNEAPDGTAPNQWEKYGTGTISSDGTRIITDINPANGLPYGIPRFCCGARRNVPPPPPPRPGGGPTGGQSGSGQMAGEPVDTATGFFYVDKTDMVLPGILPIAITRTYRTNLTNTGPFGLGTSWPYDIFLQPPPNGSADSLILFTPGNRQDLFSRQPDGSFINTTSPPLRGAVVTVAGGVRSLRFKDGSLWRFDAAGKLISQADRNGNVLMLFRDSQGRVIQISEPLGRQLIIFYTAANLRIDRLQDPIGREARYGYDASGRLINVTDAAGGITRYTYDSSNRMVTITDPRGITFLTNVYDTAGRVIRQTQADGGIWTFAYVASGSFISQTAVTDPRSQSTTYRFNAAGYLISQTDALGQTTSFDREPGTNLIRSTTDSIGRVTKFTYDASGNVATITDPAGNVRRFEYETVLNKVIKITDPVGQITRFEYDARGNLIVTVDPTGARTAIAYNSFGQPVRTTDPLGNTATFTYDIFGNLATIADPLGNETQRIYDFVSRLIQQTDPRGRSARFSYDGLNRVKEITDALNGIASFSYDGNGNLLTVTDARGSTITHTYDSMDRLATRTDPVGAVESFQYDGTGNLTRHADRKGQVSTFTYDPLNRRTGGSYADGTSTRFVFDGAGRLIESTDSVGGTILNAYDTLDRLVAETTALGTVSYRYDALGRRTRMDVTGQSPVTYGYDAASRLRQVVQGSQVVDLQYDALGRRTKLTLPNNVSTEFQYDAASRLTELIYRNALGVLGNLTYQYDAASNRLAVGGSFSRTLLPDPVASTTYDAANRQLQYGDKTMTFDANGNLTSITAPAGITAFTWDARNQLVGITSPNVKANFTYDPLSRRIAKEINGQLTRYFYDRTDIVQENIDGLNIAYLRTLSVDEVLTRSDATRTSVYLLDPLRSAIALLNGSGALTSYTYEPFGETLSSGVDAGPFQFAGRENDGTGLYHYRFRYYHPIFGRFINEDPIGLLGRDVNFYAYVYNNPKNLVDPTGEIAQVILPAAAGGISGAVGGAITGYAAGGLTGLFMGGAVGLVAGGAVGTVNPWASHAVGAAAGNMAASAIGQMLGNLVNRQDPLCNFSAGAVAGAGAGSFIGGPTTQIAGGRAAVLTATKITGTALPAESGIMVTGSVQAGQRLAEGIVDGAFSGLGELAGQRGETALLETLDRLDGRKPQVKGCR